MIPLSPKAVLKMLGIRDVDPEIVEYWTALVLRYQAAPDKNAFLREALRRALEERK